MNIPNWTRRFKESERNAGKPYMNEKRKPVLTAINPLKVAKTFND